MSSSSPASYCFFTPLFLFKKLNNELDSKVLSLITNINPFLGITNSQFSYLRVPSPKGA